MPRTLWRICLVILIVFCMFKVVFAYSTTGSGIFGGKITDTKATEIKEKEDSGYSCSIDKGGTSITIDSIKGPTTYIIPSSVSSKTGRPLSSGKWIIGRYSGTASASCSRDEESIQIEINSITLYGNS